MTRAASPPCVIVYSAPAPVAVASPRTVPQAAAPVLVPGTDLPCPPPRVLDTQSPQLHLSYYSLSVILYPVCIAVPPIPRPSDEQFDYFTHPPIASTAPGTVPRPTQSTSWNIIFGNKDNSLPIPPLLFPLLLLLPNSACTKPLLLFLVCYTVPCVQLSRPFPDHQTRSLLSVRRKGTRIK